MRLAADDILQRRYVIKRQLGEGGMGTAYLAEDLLRGTPVTIKLLRVTSPERLDAFRAEFLRLRGLVHPHLSQVHDFGAVRQSDGSLDYFYSAEYVEGETLDRYAEGRAWPEIAMVIAQALDALTLLHSLKLRHGDVKPANVLVDPKGRAVLIDLSSSQPIGHDAPTAVSGTPGFIAPELMSGKPGDHRADLYSVGATLLQIADRLRAPLPEAALTLAKRLLRKSPAERPSDVGEVLDELAVFVAKTPLPCERPARLLGRGPEMALFHSMLDALVMRREGSRCLFVHGPSGTGRTRLLQEMKWTAELRCDVVEGYAGPVAPITSMLRRATGDASITSDLTGLLRARELLAKSPDPMVLIVDDAHLLPDPELEVLIGLIRSIEPSDPYLLLCAGTTAPSISSAAVLAAPLMPLSEVEVAEWTRGSVPPRRLSDVMRLTGGFPASVHALLSFLSAGDLSEQELSHLAGKALLSERQVEGVKALEDEHKRVLGLFAVCDEALDVADLADLGIGREALSHLLHRGWIQAGAAGFRLARSGEAPRILQALDPSLSTSLHAIAARRVQGRLAGLEPGSAAASEHAARLVHHLCLAGREDEATRLLLESRALEGAHPAAWPTAAQTLAKARPEPAIVLRAAEIHEAAGMPGQALSLVASLLRARPGPAWLGLARLRAGASYLKLGNVRRSLAELRRALDAAEGDPEVRAQALDLMSRAHIKRGAYAEAIEHARPGLAACVNPSVMADLHDDIGVAATYLGDADTAREHLRKAAVLHEQTGNPRAQIRSIDYQALNEFRAGHTTAAAQGYRAALELSERHGTSHQIAIAVLNFATACHQQGELGQALLSYERALRAAIALGRVSTEVTLRHNLAKLYADIGLFERSEAAAQRAVRRAREAGMRLIAGGAEEVLGEVLLARGDLQGALDRFEAARREYVTQSAAREAALVELDRAEAHLLRGDKAAAEQAIARAQDAAISLRADDFTARAELMRGRVLLEQGEPGAALGHLEEALRLARKVNQKWLQARVEQTLAVAYEQQGSSFLAERHRAEARELWERMAASLPAHLKDAFFSHPVRAGLRGRSDDRPSVSREGEPKGEARAPSTRERKLERLLDINKKLNSSLDTKVVLGYTIDSAIELTGSERGFVILARASEDGEPGELDVAVARNMDHEKIGKSYLKFSRSIAERVIHTGEPVTTASAQEDPRFSAKESVHALRLQSVISVPIRSAGGVLGALYLDHRFRRAHFGQEDIDLLVAFADQAAIALTNARLHDELARRAEELLEKQAKIEGLLRGKTEEIDRLQEQVRATQKALEHRYDYSNIVGRGPAMRSVLATLDRVIGTNLNVLIQGESGTGKELIAKAIHFNGPRKGGPFVAVNCGALPEELLEAELFGWKRGAFTDAKEDRRGLMAEAHKGTLFLDEIGEMPIGMQVKLLRAIQEREVRPLGASETLPTDIRLVCATNRSLRDEVAQGRFRRDLFFRIGVVEIDLPPLRDRLEDIPELARHILEREARSASRPPPRLTPQAMRVLTSHPWEGNVRELENVLTKAMHMVEGDSLTDADLDLRDKDRPGGPEYDRRRFQEEEAERIMAALRAHKWNVSEVCRTLDIPRASLYRKLHRYGIKVGREAPPEPGGRSRAAPRSRRRPTKPS